LIGYALYHKISPGSIMQEWDHILVAKRDLDRALETMNIPILRSTLIRLMLSHERQKLLGRPSFGLEVIVVGRRSAGVHLVRYQPRGP
jgi:hypothetical protein